MADQFKILWECRECFGHFAFPGQAENCCGGEWAKVYSCEICGRDHDTEADVRSCCYKIANPIPAARREIETRPLPRHLMEPDLGL